MATNSISNGVEVQPTQSPEMPVGSPAEQGPVAIVISRTCELCGCRKHELVGERDRRGAPLKTVACWRCGLVSHARIPSDQELLRYYQHDYRREYNREEEPSPKRVVREWRRGCERFRLLQPLLQQDDEVFEVGAGIGCNLKQFELAGHRSTGIEPGSGFAAFSRREMGCQIETGVLEDVPGTARFDVVLLIHVLEHLPLPLRALGRIRQLLRPSGRLYVEVPNLAAPHAAPGKMFHSAHLYNFTPWTLAMAACASGFEVTRILSAERDRNLRMWLTRRTSFDMQIDPCSYVRTREALSRHTSLSYYCRPTYATARLAEFARGFLRHWTLGRDYARILRQCAPSVEREAGVPSRFRAA